MVKQPGIPDLPPQKEENFPAKGGFGTKDIDDRFQSVMDSINELRVEVAELRNMVEGKTVTVTDMRES